MLRKQEIEIYRAYIYPLRNYIIGYQRKDLKDTVLCAVETSSFHNELLHSEGLLPAEDHDIAGMPYGSCAVGST